MIKEKLDKFYVKDKAYGINNFINKVKHILTEKIKTYIAGKIDDSLGRIDGRTAAESDHEVSLACRISQGAALDRLQGGVRFDIGEYLHRDVAAFEMTGDLCGKAALHHKGIGHDKSTRAEHFFKRIERVLAVAYLCFAVKMHFSAPELRPQALSREDGLFCRHSRPPEPA